MLPRAVDAQRQIIKFRIKPQENVVKPREAAKKIAKPKAFVIRTR